MDHLEEITVREMPPLSTEDGRILKERQSRPPLFLPVVLFLITVFTTVLAGAIQQGINPLAHPLGILRGLPFAVALLTILLTHEMGHFLASRYHGVNATLPYFIPAPTFLGTFGAFIKMRSPILNKKSLVDIGAAGPVAGFVISIVFAFIGLKLSTIIPAGARGGLGLGNSLIFYILSFLAFGSLPDGMDIVLHPIAFAGWIGFFVTSLNLLPIGQLDGGHITYAILGRRHRMVSILMLISLIFLGTLGWPGWLVWAVLVSFLGTNHPPVIDQHEPLDRQRVIISWVALLIFVLTFTPVPFIL